MTAACTYIEVIDFHVTSAVADDVMSRAMSFLDTSRNLGSRCNLADRSDELLSTVQNLIAAIMRYLVFHIAQTSLSLLLFRFQWSEIFALYKKIILIRSMSSLSIISVA